MNRYTLEEKVVIVKMAEIMIRNPSGLKVEPEKNFDVGRASVGAVAGGMLGGLSTLITEPMFINSANRKIKAMAISGIQPDRLNQIVRNMKNNIIPVKVLASAAGLGLLGAGLFGYLGGKSGARGRRIPYHEIYNRQVDIMNDNINLLNKHRRANAKEMFGKDLSGLNEQESSAALDKAMETSGLDVAIKKDRSKLFESILGTKTPLENKDYYTTPKNVTMPKLLR